MARPAVRTMAARQIVWLLTTSVTLTTPGLLWGDLPAPLSLTDVTLLPSPFLTRHDKHESGTVAALSPDALLFWYRDLAGLPQPTGVTGGIGGWDNGFVRGHIAGHYLSAASRYAAAGNADFLAKVNYMVGVMADCQGAMGTGYLSAFSSAVFDGFELTPYQYHTVDGVNIGVPYYTIDKIVSGLTDAFKYTGNNQALDVAAGMADYFAGRIALLTPTQVEAMLYTNRSSSPNEFGAIAQAFTEVYVHAQARGDANARRILDLADVFNRDTFMGPLASGIDNLPGIHANTHIAQAVGWAAYANASGDPVTAAAADNFWDIVLRQHSFANGGNSFGESFRSPGIETAGTGSAALTNSPSETCNTYNMIRLSQLLFERHPDAKYASYVEGALYNHILTHNNPATGMMSYYVQLAPGSTRSYGTLVGTNWCCEGTGIENPAAYAENIYRKDSAALWVNLYVPSQVHWHEKELTFLQQGQVLLSDDVTFTASTADPAAGQLKLRVPSWAFGDVTVSVNGQGVEGSAVRGTYFTLERTWQDGDVVLIHMPRKLHLRRSMDDPSMVSVFWGPILLTGVWGASLTAAPTLSVPSADPADWLTLSDPVTMTFSLTNAAGTPDISFKPFYDMQGSGRYSVYVKLDAPSATRTWRGGGMLTAWNDGTNWDLAPGAGDLVAFDGGLSTVPDNNFKADTAFAGLRFNAGAVAFHLVGNRIRLDGDVLNESPYLQRISMPMTLAPGDHTIHSTSAPLVLAGALGGSGTLVKTGDYTLTLLAENSHAATVVNGGTLQVGDGGNSGSLGPGSVTLANHAQLIFDRSGSLGVTGSIGGLGGVTKTGPGTLHLQAPASYEGPTTIAQGVVQLGDCSVAGLIAHRWSFNGSLIDSAGTSDATIIEVGTLNTTLSASQITLAGGSRSAADHVRLGSNLLPDTNTPVTIELWATQQSIQNWSRILDFGSSSTDNIFMSWTRGTTLTSDRVEWRDAVTATSDDTNQPYAIGTEYHIALVLEPSADGASTVVSWYSAPATNGSLGVVRGRFTTTNTLATLNDADDILGRSFYSSDSTANASYNEVRIWNGALPQATLEVLHLAGPDVSFATLDTIGHLPVNTALALTGTGATLDLHGVSQNTGSLRGVAGSRITNSAVDSVVFTTGGDGDSTTFSGLFDGALTVVKTGTGTLTLVGNGHNFSGPLAIDQGSLQLAAYQALKVNGLLIASDSTGACWATLDVAGSALIVQASDVADKVAKCAALTAATASGHAAGAWTGIGITSSTAAEDSAHYGVGLFDNAQLNFTGFGGQIVDANSLIISFAHLGDANIDDIVDIVDLAIVANNWQQNQNTWSAGDLNYDGIVNIVDLAIVANNWQQASVYGLNPDPLQALPLDASQGAIGDGWSSATTAVPEPASVGLLVLGWPLLVSRRRRLTGPAGRQRSP